ncbi:hypothetical protein BS642_07535 [Chromobacterium violaceum]|nr:hypothetical protein BS642_07535 [Chromobacterium violaceum]
MRTVMAVLDVADQAAARIGVLAQEFRQQLAARCRAQYHHALQPHAAAYQARAAPMHGQPLQDQRHKGPDQQQQQESHAPGKRQGTDAQEAAEQVLTVDIGRLEHHHGKQARVKTGSQQIDRLRPQLRQPQPAQRVARQRHHGQMRQPEHQRDIAQYLVPRGGSQPGCLQSAHACLPTHESRSNVNLFIITHN